ncbi:hypothetical protein UFOVP1616_20 [uncultured Caudovirales phage]|uniref:Holliday junction resolvase n=1 Tax=uncultured Caudovirales phage TaxID=2100421 RepID=A0A6J5SWL6_9CAUD|nr:hypothetical protein UFOVP1467_36 [uncultured Caudovirales phage]CAB4219639.1 hypothetical protein UFOVP1616_20 [uncultured Caudovirales phage]
MSTTTSGGASGLVPSRSKTSRHRVHRGLASQAVVADYFRANGFPYALSTGSGRTGTDVTGVIGVDIEVKARRGLPIEATMNQLKKRASDGVIPMAVLRIDGQGPSEIANWPALMPLSVAIRLLREAGYDAPVFAG